MFFPGPMPIYHIQSLCKTPSRPFSTSCNTYACTMLVTFCTSSWESLIPMKSLANKTPQPFVPHMHCVKITWFHMKWSALTRLIFFYILPHNYFVWPLTYRRLLILRIFLVKDHEILGMKLCIAPTSNSHPPQTASKRLLGSQPVGFGCKHD